VRRRNAIHGRVPANVRSTTRKIPDNLLESCFDSGTRPVCRIASGSGETLRDIRRSGYDRDEAQDLTQAFFAVLLEKNFLEVADPQRGRFRSFLLTAVKHFLSNERDRAQALKRGGGEIPVSIDVLMSEACFDPTGSDTETPEDLFERRWALSLLEHAMSRLRAEFSSTGRNAQFDKLVPFLSRDSDGARYEELAAEMGVSAGALRTLVHRMRRRYRDLVRAEIAETVATSDEVDDEIRFLMSVLSS
jgi:DNA-directed RNA polymerase specialized sigma24 family protein